MILISLVLSLNHVPPVGHYLLRRCAVMIVQDLGLDPAWSLLALVLLARLHLECLASSRHGRNKLKFLLILYYIGKTIIKIMENRINFKRILLLLISLSLTYTRSIDISNYLMNLPADPQDIEELCTQNLDCNLTT